ncbi:MAG TPA: hypothetical protein VLS28_02540 [Candidatus Sulfomarinibacteraceae bacterium]|nr:hypothetical protein [Candidatus Sulfomarinibacteraceae bacterium]
MSDTGSAPQTDERARSAPVPRKKRGCLATGCLTILGLFAVVSVVVGALVLRVPQQLGIWPSGATLLAGTPDREAAAAILDEVAAAGVDTTGLSLYVFPVDGRTGTLAYAVLDASAGFGSVAGTDASSIADLFGSLVAGPTVDSARIEQVAIAYRDETGRTLGVLTASTEVIRRFVAGEIDERAFSRQLNGDVDLGATLDAVNTP